MKNLSLYQVDAFSSGVFSGNPAAVCPLDSWLDDALLQAIAAENNLSETAFFVANESGFQIRWFTPRGEVDLCGHATLASAYVIFKKLQPELNVIEFNSRSGILKVTQEAEKLILNFPSLPYEEIDWQEEFIGAVNINPSKVFRSTFDLLFIFDREEDITNAIPNHTLISKLPYRGLILSSPAQNVDIYSRCFYPRYQVMEDPVTGSAHCVLTPFWCSQLGKTNLRAKQGLERQGIVHCELQNDRVLLAGECFLYLEGRIYF
jgi:PhzF family phenazine biosynthesis protein